MNEVRDPVRLGLPSDRQVVSRNDRRVLIMACIHTRPEKELSANLFQCSSVVLVLDCSGSMQQAIDPPKDNAQKLQKAIDGLWAAVGLLRDQDQFSVVAFDAHVETLVNNLKGLERSCFRSSSDLERQRVEAQLRSSFGGMTNIHEALRQARSLLTNATTDATRRIILLSDGAANEPADSFDRLKPVKLAEEIARQCAQEGILLSVLGYGVGNDLYPDLLQKMALPSGGDWVHVLQPPDPILREILLGSQKVYASGVTLALTFPHQIQVHDLYRLEPASTYLGKAKISATDRVLWLRSNQLELGKRYCWMVEVDAPQDLIGETELLQAELRYQLANGSLHVQKQALMIAPTDSEAKASERDRSYYLFKEEARMNEMVQQLSKAMSANDHLLTVQLLKQLADRCRSIGLNEKAANYEAILTTFQEDHNLPRAVLAASSTSTSVTRRPTEYQREQIRKSHRGQ